MEKSKNSLKSFIACVRDNLEIAERRIKQLEELEPIHDQNWSDNMWSYEYDQTLGSIELLLDIWTKGRL